MVIFLIQFQSKQSKKPKQAASPKPEMPLVTIAKLTVHNYLLNSIQVFKIYPKVIKLKAKMSQYFNKVILAYLYSLKIKLKQSPAIGLITAVKVEKRPSGSVG